MFQCYLIFMSESYKHLVGKLNFTRKRYYLNKVIKGIYVCFIALFSTLFLLSVLESVLFFSSNTKTVLFFIVLLVSIVLFIWFVIIPCLQWLKLIKPISDKELSVLIEKQFKDNKNNFLINVNRSQQKSRTTKIRYENKNLFLKNKASIFSVISEKSHLFVQLLLSIWDAFKLMRSQRQSGRTSSHGHCSQIFKILKCETFMNFVL